MTQNVGGIDRILTLAGSDVVYGGDGNDDIYGSDGGDIMDGGASAAETLGLLDRLRAKLSIGGSETETSARGQTVRAHLPDLLRLRAATPTERTREKAVIFVYLFGGPSHVEPGTPRNPS